MLKSNRYKGGVFWKGYAGAGLFCFSFFFCRPYEINACFELHAIAFLVLIEFHGKQVFFQIALYFLVFEFLFLEAYLENRALIINRKKHGPGAYKGAVLVPF